MIRALYTATSGMMVESRRMDLASKNLFHAQTPGYKAVRVLRSALDPTGAFPATDVQTGRAGEFVDPRAGSLRLTGKAWNLALEGEGFFTVQTPGGLGYTRDGRFRVGEDRVVRDFNGNTLLLEPQVEDVPEPVQYDEETPLDAPVEVAADGTVKVAGRELGRLWLRDFPGYRGLQQAAGSLFLPVEGARAAPAAPRVLDRTLEDANSTVVTEMTQTLATVRAFESYQKVIQTVMDEVTGEAVRRLGRVA